VATTASGRTLKRPRRQGLAAVALLIAAAVVVATIVATSAGHDPKRSSHLTLAGAATVQRRNLVTSISTSGTISYADSSTVANRLLGTLTWVAPISRVINPGQVLFDVDNFPVILMSGATPAYRTLDSSDSAGPDVQQLNANLIDLGYDPDWIADNDEWQPATTVGVEAFQRANGEPQTGSLTLGTVVFLRGSQRVSSLQAGPSSASFRPTEGHGEFVDYTPSATAAATNGPTTSQTHPEKSKSTSDQHGGADARADSTISRLTTRISQLTTKVGQLQRQQQQLSRTRQSTTEAKPAPIGPAAGGNSPVMTTSSTNLVVTVNVAAGSQSVTRVGARIPVTMPSGSTVFGHVVEIGEATSSSGGGGKVPITIHLDKHENGRDLDHATVSVRFVEKTARNALSVPITALVARPGGRYAVQMALPPYALLDVALGTVATGYVQIAGKGLHPGLKITDSQG
jgi:peptidoglycan hydrolase-like protein with peptidoglycan-binding domain